MATYNQIIKTINDLAEAHKQINRWGNGSLNQILHSNTEEQDLYPVLFTVDRQHRSTDNSFLWNFSIFLLDRVYKERSNENEVKSDLIQIGWDIIALMEDPSFFGADGDSYYDRQQGFTMDVAPEIFQDRVTGVRLDFTIRQAYDFNKCVTPITGNI